MLFSNTLWIIIKLKNYNNIEIEKTYSCQIKNLFIEHFVSVFISFLLSEKITVTEFPSLIAVDEKKFNDVIDLLIPNLIEFSFI